MLKRLPLRRSLGTEHFLVPAYVCVSVLSLRTYEQAAEMVS